MYKLKLGFVNRLILFFLKIGGVRQNFIWRGGDVCWFGVDGFIGMG